jgi:hypothetical protein
MALVHVTPTGTRASGASTADDWTDANCYPTVRASSAAWAGDQTVIVDGFIAEVPVSSSGITTTQVDLCSTLTIQGRTGSRGDAVIQWTGSSGTAPWMSVTPLVCTAITIKDLTLTRGVTMTTATNAFLTVTGTVCVAYTLENLQIGGWDSAGTVAAAAGLVFKSLGTVVRTVNITDVLVKRIRTYASDASLFWLGGTNQIFNLTRVQFEDCQIDVTGASINAIGIHMLTGNAYTFTDCEATRIQVTNAVATNQTPPFVYSIATGNTLAVDGFTFTECRWGRPDALVTGFGWGILVTCPYVIENVHHVDCGFYYNASTSDGGGLSIRGASATSTQPLRNLSATRCHCRSGACVFISAGAAGSVENARGYDNECEAGVIYNGNLGATYSLVGFEVIGTTVPAEADPGTTNGIAVYARLVDGAAKTIYISNGTVAETVTVESAIFLDNAESAATLITDLHNVISINPDAAEDVRVLNQGGGGSVHTCTLRNCVTGAGGVTGTVTEVNESTVTDLSTLFVAPAARDFRLLSDSGLLHDGSPIPGGGIDVTGARFLNPPSIGGTEYRAVRAGVVSRNPVS